MPLPISRLKRQEGLWQWETNSCHLAIPVTSCTAERSFSSLRRLKTYLRSTMSQDRLNHIAILTCYHNKADCIDMKGILNSFIARNDIRAAAYATFPINSSVRSYELQRNMLTEGYNFSTFLL